MRVVAVADVGVDRDREVKRFGVIERVAEVAGRGVRERVLDGASTVKKIGMTEPRDRTACSSGSSTLPTRLFYQAKWAAKMRSPTARHGKASPASLPPAGAA